MLVGEARAVQPVVDWNQVFQESRSWLGGQDAQDPEYIEKCRQHAAPLLYRAEDDPDFQDLFNGIAPEVAVSLLCSPDRIISNLLYSAGRQDTFVLDRLVQNQTACMIVADHAISSGIPNISLPDPTDEQMISFGKTRLLHKAIEGIEGIRLPRAVVRQIGDHSMPELINAIGHNWAVNIESNALGMVDDLLDDPALAFKFCRTILEDQKPLEGTAYQTDPYGGGPVMPNHELATRKDLQAQLLVSPRFQDPAFSLLATLVGPDYVGPAVYCSVHERLQAGEAEATVATELREQINHIGQTAIKPDFLAEQAAYDGIQNELLRSVLRWRSFDYGRGDLADLLTTVDELRGLQGEQLESKYQSSGYLEVARVDRTKPLTEDMKKRLKQFYYAQFDGYLNSEFEPTSFSKAAAKISTKLEDLAAKVGQQYDAADEDTRQKIAFQLDQLQQARDYDYQQFPSGIAVLARYKQHFQLQLMTMLLRNLPYEGRDYREANEPGGIAAVGRIMENILHNGVSQLLQTPGLDKQDKRAIKDLLSMRAFEPLFEQSRSDQRPVRLNFVPVRGLLLEASGYIAKACWADQDIISRDRNNIDGLIITEQTGPEEAPAESFVGASLLIRATMAAGQPLLIIRGLNPSDSLLNKVDLTDFYDKLTSYIQDIADRDGRQAAIVIDEAVGRATTNRPALFSFLRRQLDDRETSGLQKVKAPFKQTLFNGYDVTDDTYLLPSR